MAVVLQHEVQLLLKIYVLLLNHNIQTLKIIFVFHKKCIVVVTLQTNMNSLQLFSADSPNYDTIFAQV
jgi:hypothetical protein